MKLETDKRVFILLLFVILIGLIIYDFYCSKNLEKDYEIIDNEEFLAENNISIELIEYGIYRIDGEGELDEEILLILLHKNNIQKTDVNHLIIGDDISDIGYDCIVNFPYLESLKLGNGISEIRNGSIKSLPKLEWVYMPKSIKYVGQDFLYECPLAKIVSEGKTIIENNDDNRIIIEEIDSFDSLMRKSFSQKINISSLSFTEGEEKENCIELNTGGVQYGPYMQIDKGRYNIVLLGGNFANLSKANIYINSNSDFSIAPTDVAIQNDRICYNINIEKELLQLELGIRNTKDSNIEIKGLELYTYIPEYLNIWWE